jgi:serine/threonine-protein kinase
MSPEQVKGQGTVDHRSDLWALGCMAFECVTGRPVWNTEQGVAMTFAAIAAAQIPTPSRIRTDLPQSFDVWFAKALDRDPGLRFQTAKELADDLAIALGTPPISLVNVVELEAIERLSHASSDPDAQPSSARAAALKAARTGRATPGGALATSDTQLAPRIGSTLSATDLLSAADEEAPAAGRKGGGVARMIAWVLAVGMASAVGAWFGYTRYLRRPAPVAAPVATAASAQASAAATADAAVATVEAPELPKWMSTIEDGQKLLAAGDADGAMRSFKDAMDAGGGAIAKSFLDQAKLGTATTGPCKMVSLSHPHLGYGGSVGRPTIAVTSKGAVVAWTDDHEQPGHDHVYSVLVDAAGRPAGRARDLTPEADYAMRPSLLSVGDRVVLLFWDKGGREPGVRVRWLDEDGRIGGMSAGIGAGKPGLFWPAMDRAADGTFWVTWQQDLDKEGDDLLLRHLDAELKPMGPEIRATDYQSEKGKTARVNAPAAALSSSNLFLAYTLERDHEHLVERMRLGLGTPDLSDAADARAGLPKGKTELGDVAVVNEDKVGGDFPAIACTKDACFLVWHETDKGAQAALLDPVKGTLLWRKRFTSRGGHPAVATGVDGLAEVVYYEGGRVRVASISRDGVGTTSTFAKVTGDEPRPWIAPGRARGEWLVAWLDLEAGHTEAFAARLLCRN